MKWQIEKFKQNQTKIKKYQKEINKKLNNKIYNWENWKKVKNWKKFRRIKNWKYIKKIENIKDTEKRIKRSKPNKKKIEKIWLKIKWKKNDENNKKEW